MRVASLDVSQHDKDGPKFLRIFRVFRGEPQVTSRHPKATLTTTNNRVVVTRRGDLAIFHGEGNKQLYIKQSHHLRVSGTWRGQPVASELSTRAPASLVSFAGLRIRRGYPLGCAGCDLGLREREAGPGTS